MNAFDPYHVWLGIPPDQQPPHHYRLLGVELFETNSDVIAHASDRQMAYIRGAAIGPHGTDAQKLLTEISRARLCLLDATQREAYDAKLRDQLATSTSPPSASGPRSRPLPQAVPLAPPQPPATASSSVPAAGESTSLAGFEPVPGGRGPLRQWRTRRHPSTGIEIIKVIAGGAGGIAVAVLLLQFVLGVNILSLPKGSDDPPDHGPVATVDSGKGRQSSHSLPMPANSPSSSSTTNSNTNQSADSGTDSSIGKEGASKSTTGEPPARRPGSTASTLTQSSSTSSIEKSATSRSSRPAGAGKEPAAEQSSVPDRSGNRARNITPVSEQEQHRIPVVRDLRKKFASIEIAVEEVVRVDGVLQITVAAESFRTLAELRIKRIVKRYDDKVIIKNRTKTYHLDP